MCLPTGVLGNASATLMTRTAKSIKRAQPHLLSGVLPRFTSIHPSVANNQSRIHLPEYSNFWEPLSNKFLNTTRPLGNLVPPWCSTSAVIQRPLSLKSLLIANQLMALGSHEQASVGRRHTVKCRQGVKRVLG